MDGFGWFKVGLSIVILGTMIMAITSDDSKCERCVIVTVLSCLACFLWFVQGFTVGRTNAFKELGYVEVTHPQTVTVEKIPAGKK